MPRFPRLHFARLSLVGILALPGLPARAPLNAASFVVNHDGDLSDQNLADGVCQTAGATCTLRAALEQANALTGGTTITFSQSMTIIPASPLPALSAGGIVISGVGHNITLSGSAAGSLASGLHLTSSANRIQRLTIVAWQNGVWIDGSAGPAQQNIVGTDGDGANDPAERNILAANHDFGVRLSGAAASSNVIAGNLIGHPLGPNTSGVLVENGASGNRIGTNGDGISDAAERNIIIANLGLGILLTDGAVSNVVAGNYIGLDADGNTAAGNGGGIQISAGAAANRIGTDGDGIGDAAERNVISASLNLPGVALQDTVNNIIAGNYIGTNADGTAARGNPLGGIDLGPNANGNVIGTNGDGAGDDHEGNLISANGGGAWNHGLRLLDSSGNTVAGNYIGTSAAGTAALGNNGHGIVVGGNSQNNTIGTDGDGTSDVFEGNLISGNSAAGIFLRASSNRISGNRIGTAINVASPLPNGGAGVYVLSAPQAASENWIGGLSAERGNWIAFNTGDGVHVALGGPAAAEHNAILANSIFANGGDGIDLSKSGGADTVTPNDPADADGGPNNLMNYPELTAASPIASSTFVGLQITNGLPSARIRLQFFASPTCDPSGHGEGAILLGEKDVQTDAAGDLAFKLYSLSAPTQLGMAITSTATRLEVPVPRPVDTSEFSNCVTTETSPLLWVVTRTTIRFFTTFEKLSGRPGTGGVGLVGLVTLVVPGVWRLGWLIRGRRFGWGIALRAGAFGLIGGLALLAGTRFLPAVENIDPPGALPDGFGGPLLPADPGLGPDPWQDPVAVSDPTPTAIPGALTPPRFSTDAIYFESDACGPKSVVVEVTALDPRIQSVVIFYRLAQLDGPGRTDWQSAAMSPAGDGVYRRSLHSESDLPLGVFLRSNLQVQLVATDAQRAQVERSAVIAEVSVLPCG